MAGLLRGMIRKTGSGAQFRISRPGVDLLSAGELDYLLHEDHLYTQPYYFGFVACPFAGSTSNSTLDQTVQVTIPGYDPNPIVIHYPVVSSGTTCFPAQRAFGTGDTLSGYNIDSWDVLSSVVSSTRVDIRFYKGPGSKLSPQGAYIVVMRRPS